MIKLRLALLTILSGLAASCIEVFPALDNSLNRPVVVYCILNEGPKQFMKLYYPSGAGEDCIRAADGAKAWLCGQGVTAPFTQVGETDWECELQPYSGESFVLKVYVPGRDTIMAATTLPRDFEVASRVSRQMCYNFKNSFGEVIDSAALTCHSFELVESNKYDDEAFYGEPVSWPCNIWVVPVKTDTQPAGEYLATDHLGADDFNVIPDSVASLPFFNCDYISGNSYFRGLVGGAQLFIPILFPEMKLHHKVLRIQHPASYYNGEAISKETVFSSHYSNNSFVLLTDRTIFSIAYSIPMYVYSVSDDYDAYLKKVYQKLVSGENLLSSLYDQNAGYSNIIGGVGIFGACIVRAVRIKTTLDHYPWDSYPFSNYKPD